VHAKGTLSKLPAPCGICQRRDSAAAPDACARGRDFRGVMSYSKFNVFLPHDANMQRVIRHVAVVVADYDAAIAFYRDALGFELIEDTDLGGGKRWVLVGPPGDRGASLLLARAATPHQQTRVGDQTGGRVFLFLHTDDFWGDYRRLRERGVEFTEEPREAPYGTVAVFVDLYGNRWDLVQPRA
jgi:catechol 2,3-dioxygenase-like lactoylglutathione lyase family enzyme